MSIISVIHYITTCFAFNSTLYISDLTFSRISSYRECGRLASSSFLSFETIFLIIARRCFRDTDNRSHAPPAIFRTISAKVSCRCSHPVPHGARNFSTKLTFERLGDDGLPRGHSKSTYYITKGEHNTHDTRPVA